MQGKQRYSGKEYSQEHASVHSLTFHEQQAAPMFNFTRSGSTLLFLLAGFATGCSSGGGASSSITPSVDTQSVLTQSAFSKANELVYVSNKAANSITAYATTASGNARPIVTIAGSNTHLDQPVGLTFDSSGNLYVVNHGLQHSSITIYCKGANGNVAPMGTIEGPQTHLLAQLNSPDYPTGAIAVDSKNGHLFVGRISSEQSPLPNNVLVFNLNARGDATPISSIGSGDEPPLNTGSFRAIYGMEDAPAVAFDRIGSVPQVLAGTEYEACCHGGDSWTYYDASTLTPTGSLSYFYNLGLFGLAVTPGSGNIVASYNGAIEVWPAGITGTYQGPVGSTPIPLRIITGGFSAVAVDSRQAIWALVGESNATLPPTNIAQIDVYGPSATTPVVISGPATGLASPSGIAVLR